MRSIEELVCDKGRYDYLMENIEKVNNEEDMFNLMNDVTYFNVYDPINSKYDVISKYVGVAPNFTYDFVNENRVVIIEYMNEYGKEIMSLIDNNKRKMNIGTLLSPKLLIVIKNFVCKIF